MAVLVVLLLLLLIIGSRRRLKWLSEGRATAASATSTAAAAAVAICDGQTPEAVAARPQGTEAAHASSQTHATTIASHGSMEGTPGNACAAMLP